MELIKRKQNRLTDYDYAQNGAYFITICVNDRKPILSSITVGADIIRPNNIKLTNIGKVVDYSINSILLHYDGVFVDNYVIMPNHIHMIIRIENDGGRMVSAPTIVAGMKRYVSTKIGKSIWQKSFYDHIIRDDYDYQTKWQYIDENPDKWLEDELYTSDII
jgi:putative transposase